MSIVSVSRSAFPPQTGQVVKRQVGCSFKGLSPVGFPLHIVGQKHRELVIRNGDRAAFFAVHDGDGSAPVTLAGDQPVAQTVIDRAVAGIFLFHVTNGFFQSFVTGGAGQRAGIDNGPVGRNGRQSFR